ncbi:MAG: tetratricopeptide repeat protein [Blastocatellia bacterium]|nr:tetratricopeptide repeat protein [Blastocatellia bacterium]
MSIREKYKLAKIRTEIENFSALIDAELFDEAVKYFREHLERPTLFGLEPSLRRAELLQKVEVEKLSDNADKCLILYSLALSLNLTGGYPNRAIPLYEKHDELAEKIGDYKSFVAKFGASREGFAASRAFSGIGGDCKKGLQIIRERSDFLREAVNLYWLGMGLAHRGEEKLSETALQRSLRIFQKKFASQAEGVVHAFLAQRALWLENYADALNYANKAIEIGEKLKNDDNHADLHGAVKILTAALRMKGEALLFGVQSSACNQPEDRTSNDSEEFLQTALTYAREIEFVEEELPALRALALKALKDNKLDVARDYLKQTWHLAERGQFLLYNADSYNILARVEMTDGNREKAIEAAMKAFELSICDGIPFAYQRGLKDAQALLNQLYARVLEIPKCDESKFPPMSLIEINPYDGFSV